MLLISAKSRLYDVTYYKKSCAVDEFRAQMLFFCCRYGQVYRIKYHDVTGPAQMVKR